MSARLAQPAPESLDARQRAFLDTLTRGPRGASVAHGGPHGPPGGPFGVWLLDPEFGEQAQRFGAYVRFGTTLPPRLSELAILVCARHWMAQYEFWAHAPIALKAGLPEPVVDALRTGAVPAFDDARDEAVFVFCSELLGRKAVSDPVYARAADALGPAALIELVGVLGYYTLVALTVRAFEIGVHDADYRPME